MPPRIDTLARRYATTLAPEQVAELTARIRAQARRLEVVNDCATPLDLACRFDQRTVRTAALELIARRIVETATTRDGRLVLSIPPQEGKSTLLRWAVLWLLADNPERRVAIASYAASLARTSGRIVRSYVESYGQSVGLEIDRSHADASDWQLAGHLGGLRAVGVGGGLTGQPVDCVTAETAILTTSGLVTAAEVVAMATPPKVLSWNHATGRAEWRRVLATRVIPGREVVELRAAAGRTLRCTADHRVYTTNRGYVAAADLRPGDRLTCLVAVPVREPASALLHLPCPTSQVEHDTVAMVRRVRGERVEVYDLQVEGNCNFFADEVLVHNCLIVDDPIKDQQAADSDTIRQALHDWWSSVALTRLAPGAPVIIVQTRWHEDDLAGRMEAEGWPTVNIPALADGHTRDALQRPPGTWLVSARGRTIADWEAKRAAVGERTFAALYQGRPAPLEGGVFKSAWFDLWRVDEAPPGCLPPVVVVDPADNPGSGDEAGIVVGCQHPGTGKGYVLDDLSGAMTVGRWARLALLTCVRRQAPTLAYEKSLSQLPTRIREAWRTLHQQALALHRAGGDLDAAVTRLSRADDSADVADRIRGEVAEIEPDVDAILGFGESGPRIKPIAAKGTKQARMLLVSPAFETGRMCMVGRHKQLEHQASTWQEGQDSPDRVDAMVHLAALLTGMSGVASMQRADERVPTSSTGPARRVSGSARIGRSTGR